MRGSLNSEQICNKLAVENNLDKKIILNTLKESSEKMELCSNNILDIIKDIRKKNIKVVIATDNMDTFRKFTIRGLRLDRFFDDFLISSELKVLKYDITNDKIPFFDPFLKKNSLSYDDVILLDDSEEKSGIYNKLGFKISLVTDTPSLLNYLREYLD
jgi:FMN phosphatase YigB (HAD superfamily)